MDIKSWLKEEPKPEELKESPDGSGSLYIPIGIVENLLDNFDLWSTTDFSYKETMFGAGMKCDASVLLTVQFGSTTMKRVGAVSFPIKAIGDNTDFAATALSYCTANAAKKLGNRFGRSLNGRSESGEIIQIRDSGNSGKKKRPDIVQRKQYAMAVANKDTEGVSRLENMYDFSQD